MSKYELTILSPVHISSGEEFELNYNLLEKDGFVYIYDEYRLVDFFIANDILIPSNLNSLKKLIEDKSDEIISSGLHLRKIESSFSTISKPLLENITTAQNPIITGSSIKGSLRTAILDCMTNNPDNCKALIQNCKDKRFDENRFKKRFDDDLANIFKYLKVTDSLFSFETKVYKTINVKKDKSHQGNREIKVENIANYVEAIRPNQIFQIEITDTHEDRIFQDLGKYCNQFYIPFFGDDEKQFFSKSGYLRDKVKKLSNTVFLINVGRFSGAERKSLNNLRDIKASRADDKSTTSARTFALEKNTSDNVYFEHALLPFGWILCEKVEKNNQELQDSKKKELALKKREGYEAIDKLNQIKNKKLAEAKTLRLKKQKLQEEEKKREEEEKAQKEARLNAMSPLEREIAELYEIHPNPNDTIDVVLYAAIRDGKFDNSKCEALRILKEKMLGLKKWVETSKKPQKDKKYKRTMEIIELLKGCD